MLYGILWGGVVQVDFSGHNHIGKMLLNYVSYCDGWVDNPYINNKLETTFELVSD